jgi:putative endonuclease
VEEKLGTTGESIAASHLVRQGYTILERNYRFRRYEIDIVARKGGTIVFVEVKTRSSQLFGHPVLSVTPLKSKRIMQAARGYIEKAGFSRLQVRFDVITLLFSGNSAPRVEHIENAFQA